MKAKGILRISLIVLAAVLGLAILLGALNALVGDGEWTFFWTVYRYDDTGFEVGSSTVYTDLLREVDIDWIDGQVQVILCEDFYPSVSESCTGDVSESSYMRWQLDATGERLTVKYRKPSGFLGSGENKQKDLVVRIPARMVGQLDALTLNVSTSQVTVDAIPFKSVQITSQSGEVALGLHPNCERIGIESKKGDVVLFSKDAPSVSVSYESKRGGAPILDFFFSKESGRYVSLEGNTRIDVVCERGQLTVKRSES